MEHSSYNVTPSCIDGELNISSYNVHESAAIVTRADVLSQSAHYETDNNHCTGGLGSVLLPEYSWGTFSKVEGKLNTECSFLFWVCSLFYDGTKWCTVKENTINALRK